MFQGAGRLLRLVVRCLSLAVLLAWSIALANLSTRRAFADDKPSQSPARDTHSPKKTEADRPPFDLTYVPPYATGVIAVRPNAIFADPAMKPLACMADNSPLLGMLLLPYIPFADLKLPIQEIEQIILYTHIVPDRKQPANAEGHSGMVTVTIRAAHDFDWLKMLRQIDPQTKEERCGDQVHYRSHLKPGKGAFWSETGTMSSKVTFQYFIPDKRTLVLLPLPNMLRAFRAGETTQRPHFPWDKDWKHVEHDLFAIAQDNRQAHGASKKPLGDDPFPEWAALTEKTDTMVVGVDWKDGIALQAYLSCNEPAAAKRSIQDVKTILKQMTQDFREQAQAVRDAPESARQAMSFQVELWKGLIDGVGVTRRGSTVCIHSQAKMTVAGLAKGLLSRFDPLSAILIKMAPEKESDSSRHP